MAITDIVVVLILAILVANGATQGFLRSIMGPAALIIASLMAFFVWLGTKNPATAFLTGLLGSFLLSWIFQTIVRMFVGDAPNKLSTLSRLSGATVNVIYGGGTLILALLLVTVIPIKTGPLSSVRDDMNRSITYRLLADTLTRQEKSKEAAECFGEICSISDTDKKALAEDQEIQAIASDPRIKKLLDDPTFLEATRKQDIAALMSHPGVKELTKDPAFIIKALKAYPKIQKTTSK